MFQKNNDHDLSLTEIKIELGNEFKSKNELRQDCQRST
jgi:hypothetical protein